MRKSLCFGLSQQAFLGLESALYWQLHLSGINCCLNSSKFIVFSSIEIKVNVCLILLVSAPHRPYEWELQRLKSILFQTARFVLRLLTRRPQNLFQALSPLPDVVGIRTANPHRCDYPPPRCYLISARYTFSLSVLSLIAN